MRTWHKEALAVGGILFIVLLFTGNKPVEVLGSLAVFLTFLHTQIGFRLAEAEEKRSEIHVECYWKLQYYFLAKEACWLAYFIWLGAWSALVGVGVFLFYPVWRKYWVSRRA